jgi:hypothetical protein
MLAVNTPLNGVATWLCTAVAVGRAQFKPTRLPLNFGMLLDGS